ncbi:MAG TPA: alpha-amylase family glycosyl hydrolase, partial [Longimicrobium sp.]|nr:alpha-amylase family glycosyl hydrolase [Longimicrobium sp.]
MRRIALLSLAALAAGAASLQAQAPAAGADTAWQHGGVCYEVFVRSFQDSNGDGIGDLNGLIRKLDYINDGDPASRRDLGAQCIWLMPVAESPSYHGYDVSDYYRVEPDYGTNDDFKRLVAEAHRRGIHVLVDMVLNHASSEHPYFQAALRDPSSPYRAWFRFSDTVQGRGPWGAEAWHKNPFRDEYYYGVFWKGMPDLNYDTPAVREEANRIADFWLREMGVDGFRLDAVPYLVEEGSNLAGTPGTHQVLRGYAAHIRSVKPDAWTVGEVWDRTDAMMSYYPDQLTSYFPFELSDSLLSGVRHGDARHLLDGYLRLQQSLPGNRYSPFLRNHDQTRTLTALGGDVAKARVAATLLLTLPGLPFVYYGEEIGMTGDKPDPRLRTPMQWSRAPGLGFTTGTPWEAPQGDTAATNVAAQDADRGSLLNLYRRLIHLRSGHAALARGRLVPLATSNPAVAAYLRVAGDSVVMVIANLGAAEARGVVVSSATAVLRPGQHRPVVLEGRGGPELAFLPDGIIAHWVPFPVLAPREVSVIDLSTEPNPGKRGPV